MPDLWPSKVQTAVTGLSKTARLFEDLYCWNVSSGRGPATTFTIPYRLLSSTGFSDPYCV